MTNGHTRVACAFLFQNIDEFFGECWGYCCVEGVGFGCCVATEEIDEAALAILREAAVYVPERYRTQQSVGGRGAARLGRYNAQERAILRSRYRAARRARLGDYTAAYRDGINRTRRRAKGIQRLHGRNCRAGIEVLLYGRAAEVLGRVGCYDDVVA